MGKTWWTFGSAAQKADGFWDTIVLQVGLSLIQIQIHTWNPNSHLKNSKSLVNSSPISTQCKSNHFIWNAGNSKEFYLVFRLSATVSRIGLMESCTCRHCHHCGGETPPPTTTPTSWLPHWLTPPRLSVTKRAALWSHVCVIMEDCPPDPLLADTPHWLILPLADPLPTSWSTLPGMITWWMVGALGLYADKAHLFFFEFRRTHL